MPGLSLTQPATRYKKCLAKHAAGQSAAVVEEPSVLHCDMPTVFSLDRSSDACMQQLVPSDDIEGVTQDASLSHLTPPPCTI
jgi:hypothetical protein